MGGLRTIVRKFRQFVRERHGIAAVEFAMVSPILITLSFGIYELSEAMTVYRRTSSVASTLGDLTAQGTTINNSEMADIFKSSAAILTPYDTSKLKTRVFSIEFDANGNPNVAWSEQSNWSTDAQGCLDNIPKSVKIPNQSVVCAEATYDYKSLFEYIMKGVTTYNERYYLLPRKTLSVQRVP